MSCTSFSRTLTLALLALLAACTTLDGPLRPAQTTRSSGAPSSSESPSETSSATQALLAQSRAAREAGSYAQASATIERALRIAPSDPNLWVELGEIELASGNPTQAATLARKALTLAANDSVAVADAQKLLRAAGGR
jgi:Tfp pilus assembly protein PilF